MMAGPGCNFVWPTELYDIKGMLIRPFGRHRESMYLVVYGRRLRQNLGNFKIYTVEVNESNETVSIKNKKGKLVLLGCGGLSNAKDLMRVGTSRGEP